MDGQHRPDQPGPGSPARDLAEAAVVLAAPLALFFVDLGALILELLLVAALAGLGLGAIHLGFCLAALIRSRSARSAPPSPRAHPLDETEQPLSAIGSHGG